MGCSGQALSRGDPDGFSRGRTPSGGRRAARRRVSSVGADRFVGRPGIRSTALSLPLGTLQTVDAPEQDPAGSSPASLDQEDYRLAVVDLLWLTSGQPVVLLVEGRRERSDIFMVGRVHGFQRTGGRLRAVERMPGRPESRSATTDETRLRAASRPPDEHAAPGKSRAGLHAKGPVLNTPSFAELGVVQDMAEALAANGILDPFPIQALTCRRAGRARHHRPGQDRHRQDPRLRPPAPPARRRARPTRASASSPMPAGRRPWSSCRPANCASRSPRTSEGGAHPPTSDPRRSTAAGPTSRRSRR